MLFFTWLLLWADNDLNQNDKLLNETAKNFVKLLLGQSSDYQINKVKAGRQWNNIDIWAEVNNEYFICIEDKTYTGEHSEQLERYKEFITNHLKYKSFKHIFVYLKTGNESLSRLNKIREKGYVVIDRKAILKVLNKHSISNAIFNDFKEYLNEIEKQTNLCDKLENIISSWNSAEGFYIKLQENINEWTDWSYVPNQTGGFLGFWYHWIEIEEIGELYIQIENAFEYGIKLVIKISEWDQNTEILYKILNEIKSIAEKNGLSISKPERYRVGETSTVAIIQHAFQSEDNNNFDFNDFLMTLKKLEKTLDEYKSQYNK
jgi:hypothetical protein